MSTLTKILIVLLSFASIFLCSTAISYVASTRNVQENYREQVAINQSLGAAKVQETNDHNEKKKEMQADKQQYLADIVKLQASSVDLAANLKTALREKQDYEIKYTELAASVTSIGTSVGNLDTQLASTRIELEEQRNKNIKTDKYLNEITAQLMAKTVELEALDKVARRLTEEKTSLEAMLEGTTEVAAEKVTMVQQDAAKQLVTTAPDKAVRGLITEVGKTLVSVSVGSADGIAKNTVLHVTRGDQFLCDIVVTDVDTNKAAGIRQLVQAQPKIGDHVSTEL